MTTNHLSLSLREAWLQVARDAQQRLDYAAEAPALFKPEWTTEAQRDLNNALMMLGGLSA